MRDVGHDLRLDAQVGDGLQLSRGASDRVGDLLLRKLRRREGIIHRTFGDNRTLSSVEAQATRIRLAVVGLAAPCGVDECQVDLLRPSAAARMRPP